MEKRSKHTSTTSNSGAAAEQPSAPSTTAAGAAPAATTTSNSGAVSADEPEPSTTGPFARPTSATTYNVREYQNPDLGAAALPRSKTAKGKKQAGAVFVCFNCGKAAPKLLTCGQCHHAQYCGRECQREDWRRHKRACRAAMANQAKRSTRVRKATEAARATGGRPANEECVICIGPVREPAELPCGHAYCGGCLANLRVKGVAQVCPICREDLPPGVKGLYDLGMRALMRMEGMVGRGEVSWASLPAAEQEEMDEVVAMLTEATA